MTVTLEILVTKYVPKCCSYETILINEYNFTLFSTLEAKSLGLFLFASKVWFSHC